MAQVLIMTCLFMATTSCAVVFEAVLRGAAVFLHTVILVWVTSYAAWCIAHNLTIGDPDALAGAGDQ